MHVRPTVRRMRLTLILLGLCCVATACGSSGVAPTPPTGPPDRSAAARTINAWCATREAEVSPAEQASVRGEEIRSQARLAKMVAGADASTDMYAAAQANVELMLHEEGITPQLPRPAEIDTLVRRLRALPAGSAARRWGEMVAGYRAALVRIDRALEAAPPGKADVGDATKKVAARYGNGQAQMKQARRAGIAACGSMVVNPDMARIYATLARTGLSPAVTVRDGVRAMRTREPWLFVVALADACAVPEPGDPAAGEPESSYAIGIWKGADGALRVTASDGSSGGTLATSGARTTWKPFTVDLTATGQSQRVEPCAR